MDFRNEPARPVPKYREKRPNRKKKKLEEHRGVVIPPRKVRGKISKKDYEKAIEVHGAYCSECGDVRGLEMHHCVFRSQGASGKWRNLRPLCNYHHRMCHQKRSYADKWREEQKRLYGPHFHKDKFSLWKERLIPNCTDEAYEKFMEQEAVNAREEMS